MTKIVEEALGGEYTVTVQPYPSTTGAMKAVMDGDGEIGYTADIGMTELYAGDGGFKDYKPTKAEAGAHLVRLPDGVVHGDVAAKDADKYKCWKDFSGKPVFFTPAGFMNWLNFQRIYKALGYDFKHVQIDPKTQSRRAAGRHDRRFGRLHHRRPLARRLLEGDRDPHGRQGVNPCPDEVAKLKAAGLAVVDVDPKDAFSKDVGVREIQGVPILFGYNVRADMPEDVVYKMLERVLQEQGQARQDRSGLHARWRRTSSACRCRASTPIRTFRCIRAWPSS